MKKLMVLLLAVVMMASIFTACQKEDAEAIPGNDNTTVESNINNNVDEKEVVISFSLWDDNQRAGMEKIAAAFTSINPNIKVVVEVTPWGEYWTKLNTSAQAKNMPDVVTLNATNIASYASAGMLADLTDVFAENNVNLNEFVPPAVEIYKYNGIPYGLPRDWDTVGLWYNSAIFNEVGVEVPTTWEEMIQVAQAIKDSELDVHPLVIGYNETYTGVWNLIAQSGGSIIKDDLTSGYDQAGNKEALQFMYDLIYDYEIMSTPVEIGDAWTPELALNGQVAMLYGGSWLTTFFKDDNPDMDIAPLPKKTGSDVTALVHSVGTAVSAHSNNLEAAKAFVAFLASDEASELLATDVGVLPAKVGYEDTFYAKNAKFEMLPAIIQGAEYGRPHPNAQITGWENVDLEVYGKLFNNIITVDEACIEIVERANEIFDRVK